MYLFMYCLLEYSLHYIGEKIFPFCFLLYPMRLEQSLAHVRNSVYICEMSYLLVKWMVPQILLSAYNMPDNKPKVKPVDTFFF